MWIWLVKQEDIYTLIHMETYTNCLCVWVLLLFVFVKVHWIYLRDQCGISVCVWDPKTGESWEIRSKVKARNTLQCVLCVSIYLHWWSDETVWSGRALCMDCQACDGRCSKGI